MMSSLPTGAGTPTSLPGAAADWSPVPGMPWAPSIPLAPPAPAEAMPARRTSAPLKPADRSLIRGSAYRPSRWRTDTPDTKNFAQLRAIGVAVN